MGSKVQLKRQVLEWTIGHSTLRPCRGGSNVLNPRPSLKHIYLNLRIHSCTPCWRRAMNLITRTIFMFLAITSAPAYAGPYPERDVRIIVGAGAGGGTDLLARIFADFARRRNGNSFIVENNGAAGGNVAFTQLARARPDGYTLGLASSGNIVINSHIFKSLTYDPLTAFQTVSVIASTPQVIVVNNKSPYDTLGDLITSARKNPSTISYASAGLASTPHLTAAQLGKLTGVTFLHVPYRGAAAAVTDVASNNVDFVSIGLSAVIAGLQSNTLKAIAVAHSSRLPQLPDVPTTAEAGTTNLETSTWFGLVAPAGTPTAVVESLNEIVQEMLADTNERKRLTDNFMVPMGDGPEKFASRIKKEHSEWGTIISDLGISMSQ